MTPEIIRALESKHSSKWLKQAIIYALDNDPEEVLADAQALITLLENYCERLSNASDIMQTDLLKVFRQTWRDNLTPDS